MKAFFSDAVTGITNRVTANRVVNKATASDKLELDEEEAHECAVFANTISAALIVSNLKSRMESRTPSSQFLSLRLFMYLVDNCNFAVHEELAKDTGLHTRLMQLAASLQEVEPGAARSAVRVRMEARRVMLDLHRTFLGVGASTQPLSDIRIRFERATKKKLERIVLMEGKRIKFRAVADDDITLISPRGAFGSRRAQVAAQQAKLDRQAAAAQDMAEREGRQQPEPKSPKPSEEGAAAAAAAAGCSSNSSSSGRTVAGAAFSDPESGDVVLEGSVLPPDALHGQHAGAHMHGGRVSSPPLPKSVLSHQDDDDDKKNSFVAGELIVDTGAAALSQKKQGATILDGSVVVSAAAPEGKARRRGVASENDDGDENQAAEMVDIAGADVQDQQQGNTNGEDVSAASESAPLPVNHSNHSPDEEPVAAFEGADAVAAAIEEEDPQEHQQRQQEEGEKQEQNETSAAGDDDDAPAGQQEEGDAGAAAAAAASASADVEEEEDQQADAAAATPAAGSSGKKKRRKGKK